MTIRLRHVARVNPATPEFDRLPEDASVPFLPLEAVWPGGRLDTTRRRPKGEVSVGYTRFREGDILVPKITPTFQADRTVIVRNLEGGVGAGTTELHIVRVTASADVRYIRYLLSSKGFLDFGQASMIGVAGQKRVPDDCLRDLVVPLSDQAAQKDVADYLDVETLRIDGLIAKKRRMIGLLDEAWAAELMAVVSPPWASASILRDEPLSVPDGWRIKKLGALTRPGIPVVYGILLPGPRLDKGVPYIGAGDVRPDRLTLSHLPRTTPEIAAQYPRTRMQAGELVYAIRGSFGAIEELPQELEGVNLSRDAARIAPASDVRSRWLLYALKSELAQEQFRRREVGATITGVNIEDLKSVRLPVPSLDEQVRIATQLDTRYQRHQEVRLAVRKQAALLTEHRQALITAAVTGEFDGRAAA
jgi:type I restriction enzyme, S subunit